MCQVGCVKRRVHEWFYVCEEYTRQESSLITKAKPNQWQQQHINTNTNPHNIWLGCYHISVTDVFGIITPTTSSPTQCTHVHIQTHTHARPKHASHITDSLTLNALVLCRAYVVRITSRIAKRDTHTKLKALLRTRGREGRDARKISAVWIIGSPHQLNQRTKQLNNSNNNQQHQHTIHTKPSPSIACRRDSEHRGLRRRCVCGGACGLVLCSDKLTPTCLTRAHA